MESVRNPRRVAVVSGLITAGCVLLLLAALVVMTLILEQAAHVSPKDMDILAVVMLVISGLASGGLWGGAVAHVTGIRHRWAMRIGGMLGLIPSVIVVAAITHLLVDNGFWIRSGIEYLPEHLKYRVMFGLSVFVAATLSTLALSAAALRRVRAVPYAALIGLVSTAVFLLVVLIMDVLSYRIGSGLTGRLIDLPPMPFVTIVASAFSALAGGTVMGALLYRHTDPERVETPNSGVTQLETAKA